MLNKLMTSVFGSRNERLLKQYQRNVALINAFEPAMQALDDAGLKAKTAEFKQRLADGSTLDSLLPEAFAVAREASRRALGMRPYDVQLIGGMVLHDGKIAEMRTGEGKTLVATLPIYLNALMGKGVHLVTVNDYLARRDAGWMGKLYAFLGLSVGVVVPGMRPDDKRAAYAADITYGTNNEFGFDYLRDNMAMAIEERFQRGQNFAIVDEVDSILIDEARTPLIISGPSDESPQLYVRVNRLVPELIKQTTEEGEGDFWVDEKQKQVHLSEAGMEHAEVLLRTAGIVGAEASLYDSENLAAVHHLNAALRAHHLYQRDVGRVVQAAADRKQSRLRQHLLGVLVAVFGKQDLMLLLVDPEIAGTDLFRLADEPRRELVQPVVHVDVVVGLAGDDERRPRFVDQDRVDLVDDRVVEAALPAIADLILHVVTEIIEAEFVVGPVRDVRAVCGLLVGIRLLGEDHADAHPQELVDLAHPLGVAAREVVIDGDDMHAVAGQCIEIRRQRRDQRLAFAGPHFGDLAVIEHHAADHLDVEVAHPERPLAGLADQRKRFGQDVRERFAVGHALAVGDGLRTHLVIAQRLHRRLELIDPTNVSRVLFDQPVIAAAEDFLEGVYHMRTS